MMNEPEPWLHFGLPISIVMAVTETQSSDCLAAVFTPSAQLPTLAWSECSSNGGAVAHNDISLARCRSLSVIALIGE